MNELPKVAPLRDALKAAGSRGTALLGGAGAVVLALGGLTVAMAPSASADGVPQDGNPTCAQLIPGSKELKFDPPNSGSKSEGAFSVTMTVRTLAVDDPNHAGDQTGSKVIDFVATGGAVLGVIVKGGPVANFYDYRPGGVLAGTSLHTPVNTKNKNLPFYGLSHVNFCYGKPTTPTPSTSPSESPTTSPSTSPSASPSTSPSESPTTSPSESPSESPTTSPSDTPSQSPSTSPTDSPTTAPTSTTSTPVVVPTEIDAGLSGPQQLSNASASTSHQSPWSAVLLVVGGVLLFAGVLKSRLRRRGNHAA